MSDTEKAIPLNAIYDLLMPGLRDVAGRAQVDVDLMMPLSGAEGMSIALKKGLVGYQRTYCESLFSAEDLRSGAYKKLFIPRVLAAIGRLNATGAGY